jgi:ligand-binding sensor domain-containing protein
MWRLVLDGKGRIWIFSEHGISRIQDGEPRLEAELYATHYAVDSEGKLWIVTGMEQQLWVADNND